MSCCVIAERDESTLTLIRVPDRRGASGGIVMNECPRYDRCRVHVFFMRDRIEAQLIDRGQAGARLSSETGGAAVVGRFEPSHRPNTGASKCWFERGVQCEWW